MCLAKAKVNMAVRVNSTCFPLRGAQRCPRGGVSAGNAGPELGGRWGCKSKRKGAPGHNAGLEEEAPLAQGPGRDASAGLRPVPDLPSGPRSRRSESFLWNVCIDRAETQWDANTP